MVMETMEVYFDDFRVEHIKSPVVSSQDYYPFGLTFGNYQRENSLNNQYQYNGKRKLPTSSHAIAPVKFRSELISILAADQEVVEADWEWHWVLQVR